jgi:hypothetical protein
MSDIKTIVINEGKKGADGAVGPAGPPGSPGANGADGADGAIIAVMDEGSTLTSAATSINFVGAGVTATMPTADEILITIPGGSGANTALSNLDVTTAVSQDLLMATGKTLRLPHQTPLLARNSAGTGTIELLQVYGIGNAVFFGNKAAFSYVALDTGNVSISTNNNSDGDVYLSANTLTLGYAGGVSAPKLQFSDRDENFYVSIKAPETLSAGYTLTLPPDDGTVGQVLETDGTGTTTWATKASTNLGNLTTTSIGVDLLFNAATFNIGSDTIPVGEVKTSSVFSPINALNIASALDIDLFAGTEFVNLRSYNGIIAPALKFYEESSTFSAGIKAPEALAANYTLTLPVDTGIAGQSLKTDGAGNLYWG